MKCQFCGKELEQDNNTNFCNEQCEYDYLKEFRNSGDSL